MVGILGQHCDLSAHPKRLHAIMHDGAVVVWHREIRYPSSDVIGEPFAFNDSSHEDLDEVVSVRPALLVMKSDDVAEFVRRRVLASAPQRHLRFRIALTYSRPATVQFHYLDAAPDAPCSWRSLGQNADASVFIPNSRGPLEVPPNGAADSGVDGVWNDAAAPSLPFILQCGAGERMRIIHV